MTDRGVRLGTTVHARRLALGRTRQDVSMASRAGGDKGLSMETIRSIERNERDTVHPSTARGLERGLDWPAGYVDRILDGDAEDLGEDRPRPNGGDVLTARLARIEAELGIREPGEISDRQAVAMILKWLTDDQYEVVAVAVKADPRFQAAT